MLKMRVLSALAVIPVVLLLARAGSWPFFALIVFAASLALREYYILTRNSDPALRISGFAGNLILLSVMYLYGIEIYFISLAAFFLAVHLLWTLLYPRDFNQLAALIWGKIYITTLLSFFLLLRGQEAGFMQVVLTLIAVWATDSGAFFIGIAVGRRRLLPAVSPKKTIEGACGGIATAMAVLLFLAPVFGLGRLFMLTFAFLISLAGQAGDLAESALKRWSSSKDSGSFLPGHGGVLDRLDSLIFAAPLAYLIFRFFA